MIRIMEYDVKANYYFISFNNSQWGRKGREIVGIKATEIFVVEFLCAGKNIF
jgi:hypothetical protein